MNCIAELCYVDWIKILQNHCPHYLVFRPTVGKKEHFIKPTIFKFKQHKHSKLLKTMVKLTKTIHLKLYSGSTKKICLNKITKLYTYLYPEVKKNLQLKKTYNYTKCFLKKILNCQYCSQILTLEFAFSCMTS